jgi:hypothetical protein
VVGRRTRLLTAASVIALAASGSAFGAKGPLVFRVSLVQEATYRHPHPPPGDAGDTFSTTLRLNAIGTVLGFPSGTPMGTMAFTWGPLNGSCSTAAASCSGTTNISTLTRLPGGTITAGGSNVSLATGIVIPVEGGTGIFEGVKGKIEIAPQGVAVDVFELILP